MRAISRRTVAWVLMLSLLLLPSIVAASDPVRIGFLYCFSGRLAHSGAAARQGAELAIEEINRQGGVNGRPIAGIFKDTQLVPASAVSAVQELVTKERADAIVGIMSDDEAKAVAPVANQLQTPLIITGAMTPDVTGRLCNPFTFRVCLNTLQNLRGAAALSAGLDAEKWTTIGPDDTYGHEAWENFQKLLWAKRPDFSFVGQPDTAFVPPGATDYKPFIDKIVQSGARGVLVTFYGGNLVDFIRQGNKRGIFGGNTEFVIPRGYSTDVLHSLGLEMPKGVWLGGLYWHAANTQPANQRFVEAYAARFKIFPDYNAHGAYAGLLAYVAAARKAGGVEKAAVARALEGLEIDLPVGTVTLRPEDHQAICETVWGKTAEYDPKFRCRLLEPLKVLPGYLITPPVAETGCSK